MCKKIIELRSFENTKTLVNFYFFSDCNKQDPSQTRNRLKNLEFFIL
ncbi:hypothetical protein LEP1GSC034_2180 [Leptospira interrogans str. 2003000735]|uniref:Uncharacterized protein n=2 Tax=Leptospira interrogans TaxID=173 RepID=A0A0F6HGB1_LEPIR|nr:hypothetical protein LEP1GSC007_1481 [Leptospira interrogans serovar Bulgarica str. Mallika]EKN90574.1 hypothetical protein LEP1GSC027_1722 [Leptospira interrogans str. 2002000624]EKO27420.1 hypothetical protein LEP1GSC104_1877 [Leptospira interrogans str. UI 12621]EKQ36109.1 hypothetical protein LEP1GSC025_0321 [Leptospira interrogans str. 2002000621]EKQ50034.1 hypothetical protein LEP1GSC026_1335 [Leptospira interrogans str. 2002000623]EMJ47697.1 hypothetical protein LEP1GSC111_3555 [Lept